MRLTLENINEYIGARVHLRLLRPEKVSDLLRAIESVDELIYITGVTPTLIQATTPDIIGFPCENVNFLKKNMNVRWEFHTEEIPKTNAGRTICFKCACPTEKKLDFSTFVVMDMCPLCHI